MFSSQGSGFRVRGSGFRVQGSGFGVQGSRSRVGGSGFRVYCEQAIPCRGRRCRERGRRSRPAPRLSWPSPRGTPARTRARVTDEGVGGAERSGDETPYKVTPVILHGVVSPDVSPETRPSENIRGCTCVSHRAKLEHMKTGYEQPKIEKTPVTTGMSGVSNGFSV